MDQGNVEYLVLCALDTEFHWLKAFFPPASEGPSYVCEVDRKDGSMVRVAVANLDGMGQAQAAARAMRQISKFHPRTILIVGICGGIDDSGVRLGDVVVPEYVVNAGHLKDESTPSGPRQVRRGVPQRVHGPMLETARQLENEVRTRLGIPPRPAHGAPKIWSQGGGTLGCSDEVIRRRDNPNRLWLRATYGDRALAVNMESAGIAESCHETGIPFLVIRGVQDDASEDTDNAKKDEWRPYSAAIAAATARCLVEIHSVPAAASIAPQVIPKPNLTQGPLFPPVILSKDGARMSLPDLVPSAKAPVKFVHGPGGSGKSHLVIEIAELAKNTGHVVLVPPLLDATSELGTTVFEAALKEIGWTRERLRHAANTQAVTLVLDGLNELESPSPASASPTTDLYSALRDEVKAFRAVCKSLYVLATDREPREFLPGQEEFTLGPLDPATVEQVLDASIGPGTYRGLPSADREILGRPFHLQLALQSQSSLEVSQQMRRLLDRHGLTRRDSYIVGVQVLDADGFASILAVPHLPVEIHRKLSDSPATSENGKRFSHHMWRDLFAAFALADDESRWTPGNFDQATTFASGSESLAMTYELLESPDSRFKFLTAVFDWNYRMPALLLRTRGGRPVRDQDIDIRWAVLAGVAEKLHGEVLRATSQQSKAILEGHPDPIAGMLLATSSKSDVRRVVRAVRGQSAWFAEWQAVFCRDGGTLLQSDLASLASPNSLLGWGTANLARRCTIEDDTLVLLARSLTDSTLNATYRWRMAHVLGAHARDEQLKALRQSIANPGGGEGSHWIVYGSARALVERVVSGARTSVQEQALEQLLISAFLLSGESRLSKAAFTRQIRAQFGEMWRNATERGMLRTLFVRTIELQDEPSARLAMQADLRAREPDKG